MRYLIFLPLFIFAVSSCKSTQTETDNKSKSADTTAVAGESENYVEYHPNGLVKITGKKINGKREGLWRSYYEDGKQWSETTFRNGVKNGRTRTYYENGMMRYSGQYKDDERVGVWKFYNDKGALDKTLDMSSENPETP